MSTHLDIYDVAVIGGGPVGSYVGAKLAGGGRRVVVLEQKERLGQPVCCTGIISQKCVSEFSVDEGLILRRLNSASLFSPGGKVIKLWRPQTQACVINRATFDLALANAARGAGARYILGCYVKKVVVGQRKVTIEAVLNSERWRTDARAVVVASGYSPRLVEGLGLGKISDFALGVQADVRVRDCAEVEVYTGRKLARDFFTWLVPTEDGMARAGLISRRQPKLHLNKFISWLTARGKVVATEMVMPPRQMPLGLLPRTYGRRLLVVGDAAGQVKPTTGGGIYYGLKCAEIAAEELSAALNEDDLSARRLAEYQRRWRDMLGQDIMLGGLARRFYQLLSDGQLDGLFNLANASGTVKALLAEDNLSFDWHGRVIASLLKKKILTKVAAGLRIPLKTDGSGDGGLRVG